MQLILLHREFQLDRLDDEQLAKFEEARSRITDNYSIVAVQKLAECFVQHVSLSEDGRNLLMVSSDKELRLMYIDRDVIGQPGKRVFYQRSDYKDVINGRKWQNSAFARLNKNTMIIDEQNQFEYEKIESRSIEQPKKFSSGPTTELFYGQ